MTMETIGNQARGERHNGPAIALLIVFFGVLLAIPAYELMRAPRAKQTVAVAHSGEEAKSPNPLAQLLSSVHTLKAWGDGFADSLVVGRFLRPPVQTVLTGWLRAGAGQVVAGPNGWLHFRPDIEHLTGPGFLSPSRMATRRQRTGFQPDPRLAILQFRDQLAQGGIVLVIMPIPVKAGVHPASLSPSLASFSAAVENPSLAELKADLASAGVTVFDPTQALSQAARTLAQPVFLKGDTHWRPEGVEAVARELAAFVTKSRDLPPLADPEFVSDEVEIAAPCDLARMIGLDRRGFWLCGERARVRQVITGQGGFWRPTPSADVLLLADSFANIYSLAAMGDAESAGLAERLSVHLRRPLDLLVRNGDAAFATRELLSLELARGRDRLAGKRVVIWELAARELSGGDWKLLPMELRTVAPSTFVTLERGQTQMVTGTIAAMAPIPRPRSAPYADYVVGLRLTDLDGNDAAIAGKDVYVFVWAMRQYELLPAASLRLGQRVTLRLKPWAEVGVEVESASRGELYGDLAMQAQPCWGEEIEQ